MIPEDPECARFKTSGEGSFDGRVGWSKIEFGSFKRGCRRARDNWKVGSVGHSLQSEGSDCCSFMCGLSVAD